MAAEQALWLAVLETAMNDAVFDLTEKQMRQIKLGLQTHVYLNINDLIRLDEARNYFTLTPKSVMEVCNLALMDYDYVLRKYKEKMRHFDKHIQIKVKPVLCRRITLTEAEYFGFDFVNKQIEAHDRRVNLANTIADRMLKNHHCKVTILRDRANEKEVEKLKDWCREQLFEKPQQRTSYRIKKSA
jgi:hypothetical protein